MIAFMIIASLGLICYCCIRINKDSEDKDED
jgi:hypothetical protein